LELQGSKVYVAGHRGMVGSAIVRQLQLQDCDLMTADHADLDLRNEAAVNRWFADHRPEIVFLAAAKVGGILANRDNPVSFLSDNLRIQLNVITAAHETGVRKLVFLGSSCVYPREAPQPIQETALLTGPLEATNEWYAIAKIAGIKLCQAYVRDFGHDFISVMPCNLYGQNDNFDLTSAHVLPALLRKAHEAQLAGNPLTLWGTGEPRREFLHVDDAATAIVFAAENYAGELPLNIGAGQDISIRDLAGLICQVVGISDDLIFDTSKPDGTLSKLMDSSRLNSLGWQPGISLLDGIKTTYQWYLESYLSR
jgi:GDP-L-fucose synthase